MTHWIKYLINWCNFYTKKIVCLPISFYQLFISPFLPQTCRFYPSCSVYAKQAIQVYGIWHGLYLSIKRISKCQPFCSKHGYDPVPKNHHH